jgi:hypothetical protein
MKAQIHITGQIGGNFKLLSKLNNGTKKEGMFNSFFLTFDSIGEGKKAMKQAWKIIKSEDDNLNWFDRLNKDLTVLTYDSSQAKLTKHYNNENI